MMEHTSLDRFPVELLQMIGSHLPYNKLFVFRAGCQRFKRLYPEQIIFRTARRQYLNVRTGHHGDKLCMIAVKRGDLGFLKLLVRYGYRFPQNIVMTCILQAPLDKRLSLCRYLISLGYPPTGLRWVVSMPRYNVIPNDMMDLVKLLTSKCAFTKKTIRNCLQAIIYDNANHFDLLKHLLFIGTETTGPAFAGRHNEIRVTLRGPFLRFLTSYNTGGESGIQMGKKLRNMIYPNRNLLTGDTATDLLRGVNLLG